LKKEPSKGIPQLRLSFLKIKEIKMHHVNVAAHRMLEIKMLKAPEKRPPVERTMCPNWRPHN